MKCEGGVCFHGAFSKKSDAKRKAGMRKGARVKFVNMGRVGWRYIVVSGKGK